MKVEVTKADGTVESFTGVTSYKIEGGTLTIVQPRADGGSTTTSIPWTAGMKAVATQ